MQKLKQAEKESAERKRLLQLMKKKAVKAVKNEADKDSREEAEEEEDIHFPEVGSVISCTVTFLKSEEMERKT